MSLSEKIDGAHQQRGPEGYEQRAHPGADESRQRSALRDQRSRRNVWSREHGAGDLALHAQPQQSAGLREIRFPRESEGQSSAASLRRQKPWFDEEHRSEERRVG